MKIKIYSDPSHAVEKYKQRYLIHPLRAYWGDGTDQWPLYEPHFAFYRDIFEIVDDIGAAEICLLPMNWNYYVKFKKLDQAKALADLAADSSKKIFIWVDGDRGIRAPYKNAIVLQNAAQRSKKKPYQLIRPGDARDLVKECFDGVTPIREQKPEKPLVGFCGQADSDNLALVAARNLKTQVSYFLRLTDYEPITPIKPHMFLRKSALNYLSTSPYVQDHFIVRRQSTSRNTRNDQWRNEFIKNMQDTDYTLHVRGTANYSIRFFETLSMGRIPIFVDTDCALPFDHIINYQQYCVWVDQHELSYIAEKVRDFHNSLSSSQFIELQKACRDLWVNYLSPQGFHEHFYEYVRLVVDNT